MAAKKALGAGGAAAAPAELAFLRPKVRTTTQTYKARMERVEAVEAAPQAPQPWLKLVAYEQTKPRHRSAITRNRFMERILVRATESIDLAVYAKDPDTLKLWHIYLDQVVETATLETRADALARVRDALNYMKNQSIGTDAATFYVYWAEFETQHGGDVPAARQILLRGQARGAEPLAEVNAALNALPPCLDDNVRLGLAGDDISDDEDLIPSSLRRSSRTASSSESGSPGKAQGAGGRADADDDLEATTNFSAPTPAGGEDGGETLSFKDMDIVEIIKPQVKAELEELEAESKGGNTAGNSTKFEFRPDDFVIPPFRGTTAEIKAADAAAASAAVAAENRARAAADEGESEATATADADDTTIAGGPPAAPPSAAKKTPRRRRELTPAALTELRKRQLGSPAASPRAVKRSKPLDSGSPSVESESSEGSPPAGAAATPARATPARATPARAPLQALVATNSAQDIESTPVANTQSASRVMATVSLSGPRPSGSVSGNGTPGVAAAPRSAGGASSGAGPRSAPRGSAGSSNALGVPAGNCFVINGRSFVKLEIVGKGGSSKVYKVMAPNRKIYACKRIKFRGESQETIESYVNEITLLKRLQGHDNIINLLDSEVKVKENEIYLIMEYGETDLSSLLKRQRASSASGRVDDNFVRFYWQQMLQAVHTIHEERIVHGDLKPANFLLVDGQLKLIDFGIAKAISNDTTNIVRDNQIGTLNYMSPEAILDTNSASGCGAGGMKMKLGRASDIWSLGCILYQMVYGECPFAGLNVVQKLQAIINPNYTIKYPETSVTPALVDLVASCLRRDPKERLSIPQLLDHAFVRPVPLTRASLSAVVEAVLRSGADLRHSKSVAHLAWSALEAAGSSLNELNTRLGALAEVAKPAEPRASAAPATAGAALSASASGPPVVLDTTAIGAQRAALQPLATSSSARWMKSGASGEPASLESVLKAGLQRMGKAAMEGGDTTADFTWQSEA
ncbi:TTK protein kinase [Thecamonas trahens ATCC 50062]|uniref:TTK protein kinase n=1 Tax=Thecamonas trahens ATCC 50062 TaxID=461836 RepID=A0A0L0DKA7_THETB|nr:TTK protein kinase [Thecamonas trahens ATCC 50062]KNC52491.1 TTK protein kinase [Thecamonas trahens ATCC 50062]|eukprot:XP_013755288.1 TTK protein kinase [Thecamonas trahens ATCC 50062]